MQLTAPPRWKTAQFLAPLVVILGATVLVVVYLSAPIVKPTMSFASPAPDESLTDKGLRVRGSVSGLEDGAGLWLATMQNPRGPNDTYQPQDKPCVLLEKRVFDCDRVYAGTFGDPEKKYDVIILQVTLDAALEFKNYNDSNPKERGYPGLKSLPSGAIPLGQVTVVRHHEE